MRTLVFAAAIALAGASAGIAQPRRPAATAEAPPPAAAPTPLPRLLADAGYAHPDISPSSCQREAAAKQVRCTVPAMSAGPYLIVATGTSTAAGEGAVQALQIKVGGAVCAQGRSRNTGEGAKPWTTGAQTLRIACVVNLLTDQPLVVQAEYADSHATTSAGTPTLAFQRAGWPGMLGMQAVGGTEDQPKAQ